MAVAYVNSVQNSGTGTSLALVFPLAGPVAHHLLVLAVRVQAGVSITGITDTLGHSWTVATPESPLAVGADHVLSMYYILDCLGGADTITIATGSSALICAAVGEWSGLGPPAMLDQHNAATGTSTTPNSSTVNTVDTIEAAIGVETSVAGNLFTANGTPNSWTFRENAGTNKLQFYSQELAATQAGMNLQGTLTSDTWGAMIATFKSGLAGGWSLYRPYTLGSPIAAGVGSGLFYYWRRRKQERPDE